MKILIKGGRVIDPANNLDEVTDILIEGTKISKIAKNIKNGHETVIEAAGKIVIPGIIDMHVHLRDPGREDKETVESGTLAAAKGGVTSILAMPNTHPAMDSGENIKLLKGIIQESAHVNVFISGAITKERLGKTLTDIPGLKVAGAIAISDDGASVDNPDLMSEALRQAKKEKIALISHAEDKQLSAAGVVNFGLTSTRMGLRGISRESEYKRVERDIELAKKADAPVHITHISCRESVELIAQAKQEGVKVTCDATPHHFTFNEEAVLGFDTNFKMNPPLRGKSDVIAIQQGLKDGTIDAIASDHAPHTENEKEIEFERAEFGVIGLETELASAVTTLIQNKILGWPELVKKFALNPAKILRIDGGSLSMGSSADIAVIDPDKEWVVKKEEILSKSKNCAFLGKTLKGKVEYTMLAGKIIYSSCNS